MFTNNAFTNASQPSCSSNNRRFILQGSTVLMFLALFAVSALAQNHRVALQAANGQYVAAINSGGGEIAARGPAISVWETLTMSVQPNNQVALQAPTGHYFCAENAGQQALVANRTAQGAWETFTRVDLGNDRIALRAVNGKYVCAEYGGGSYLIANRSAIGPWETFRLIDLGAVPHNLSSVSYGTSSVGTFKDGNQTLLNTYASAKGFRDYLMNKDAKRIYWLDDAEVKPEYFLDTASWTGATVRADHNTLDAAMIGWHSSHGTMKDNVYTTWMGTNGANGVGFFGPTTGSTISSNVMSLGGTYYGFGDQSLRYMFWDTCLSLRYTEGNTPYATWGPAARGIRMIMGYDTKVIDDPNYGKYFWEEWEKGKSISTAFLDASWRINNKQTPVAMAFGSSQEEARNVLLNEHFFSSSAISKNESVYQAYRAIPTSATTASRQSREVATMMEQAPEASIYRVEAQENRIETVRRAATGLGLELDGAVRTRSDGFKLLQTQDATLMIEVDGSYELTLKQPVAGITAAEATNDETIIEQATVLVERTGLNDGQQLEVGMIRVLEEGIGNMAEPQVIEKTVIFKQVLNGLAFNDPQAGHLEVSFNPQTGRLMRLRNSLKRLAATAEQNVSGNRQTVAAARAIALRQVNTAPRARRGTTQFEMVAGSESVGYSMVDGKVTPVYRVILQNTAIPGSRPQEIIIPLVQMDKSKIE